MRNNIQKMKIDMANEVIDAGRFDMNTTMDERRQTLEEMLQVGVWGLQRQSISNKESMPPQVTTLLPIRQNPEPGSRLSSQFLQS